MLYIATNAVQHVVVGVDTFVFALTNQCEREGQLSLKKTAPSALILESITKTCLNAEGNYICTLQV